MGRALWRGKFPPLREFAQGGFTPPEHLKNGGHRKIIFCGADDKQLDDLSIAVTRKEQDEAEG